MKKPLAVFLGDPHLQEGAWPSRPSLRGDALHAFECAVDAVPPNTPVFIAGDLFDSRQPSSYVINEYLRIVEKKPLTFYFIQGQHEACHPPWGNVSSRCQHLDGRSVTVGKYTVTGMDWTLPEDLPAKLSAVASDSDAPRGQRILLCHQVWKELTNFHPEGSLADVTGFTTIVTGDRHTTKMFRVTGADGPIQVLSPGALAPQNITEPSEAWVHLLYEEGWKRKQIPTRGLVRVPTFETEKSFRQFVDQELAGLIEKGTHKNLPEELQTPILTVSLAKGLKVDPELIRRTQEICKEKAHLFLTAPRYKEAIQTTAAEELSPEVWWEEAASAFLSDHEEWAQLGPDLFQLIRARDAWPEQLKRMKEEVC